MFFQPFIDVNVLQIMIAEMFTENFAMLLGMILRNFELYDLSHKVKFN